MPTSSYYHFAETSVALCNNMAFKEGKVHGPCMKFQKQLQGSHTSMRQADSIWKKQR